MSHSVVVLASSNAGKLRELNRILAPLDVTLHSQAQYQVPDVPEDGLSFVENAIIKARAAAAHTGLPAIADDSGLEVDYLNGAPGIHSARYSGEGDAGNNARLLRDLAGVPDEQRGARYQCVLVYMRHATDPNPLVCQGSWEGRILTAGQGEGGFGYDPLFFLEEYGCSAAELDAAIKNRISHRAHASALLLAALQKQT
ncbi:RdgB/HAM1 family non-canonical purine NTP pyrophosphatase [Pseudohalioglobus lutimaris]|uniref:dITP/XTP pyrophosphatase n=1 Tax=Pseudohalioglobus lutimaris TaxID=1737061 RepID=A0A2N5X8Z5_9GAMM|nr:RdgB/HAM1 family non-canonical purine NTP pyrophosphatase [Pseudohalioglobus lutimaris]PLW70967.1 non-canonical purine NTP pyrophosphatase, RdgB/HAM1 family [Pseudohalioglobus lutimaris]